MEFALFALLVAAGGGFFGAAIGGLNAFVFTGFMVITGVTVAMAGGGTGFLDDVAFGPFFGPHVAFAGGVAAVAFASRRSRAVVGARIGAAVDAVDATATTAAAPAGEPAGRHAEEPPAPGAPRPGGKEIETPLVSLERPTVLVVGAVAGMLGYLVEATVAAIPWFGENTDSVALTVVVMGLATRLAFGTTGMFATTTPAERASGAWNRFAPHDHAAWIRYHERVLPSTLLGAFVGLLAAGLAITLVQAFPALGDDAAAFMFGVSAVSLLFLALGKSFPVTHHISIVAGVGAVAFLPVVGDPTLALLIGTAAGVLAAWLGELFARLWHDGGDTHVDPPAAAIWPATTVVLGLAALLG